MGESLISPGAQTMMSSSGKSTSSVVSDDSTGSETMAQSLCPSAKFGRSSDIETSSAMPGLDAWKR